jgi:hypothetical protein
MPDHALAERHLGRVDPIMRGLIRALGPCTLARTRGLEPYQGAGAGGGPTSSSTAPWPRRSWRAWWR